MKRLALTCLVLGAALVTAAAGESAPGKGLCVGGPHCYSTLQTALDAARDGDTIRVGPGTFAGGITITHNVTLRGVGAAASRISGGGPVMTIGSATSTPTVTLTNLTITGGLTTTNPHAPECGLDVPVCGPGYADATAIGGGIETFAGTTVTLRRSVVTGNRATPAQTTDSVKATCANGPCPAAFGDGAGIDVWGSMTLIDSTVSDNHASAPAQSNGGGIAVHSGASVSLQGSRVTGNSAAATGPTGRFVSGGGIFVNGDATLAVDNSSIDGNSAQLTSSLASPYPIQDGNPDLANSFGGGVFLNDGSAATIRNSTLDGNTVSVNTPFNQSGGFDAALCACGEVALTVANTRVVGNQMTVSSLASDSEGPSGPAIFEADGNGTSITNTRIDGNTGMITTSDGSAGIVAAVAFFPADVPVTLTNSSISHNAVTANALNGAAMVNGGGLLNNGPLMITNSNISGNRGTASGESGLAQGGGIANGLFGGPAPLTLTNSHVVGNVLSGSPGVTLSGGGIYTVGFPITLTNTQVAHNSPDNCEGCSSNGRIAWKGFPHAGDFSTSAIYTANPDGSSPRQVTNPQDGIVDDLPDWSPDGSKIVFERIFQPDAPDLPTVADEVMRINADGSGLTQIGTCAGNCVSNDDPQYSPDGSHIVYTRLMHVSDGSLALGVWVMGSDGSNPHQITQLSTPTGSEDHEPAWSPDGTSIVFTRINDTADPVNQQALFVVPSSGGDPQRITPWTLNAGGANWSPDGSTILFQSYRDCPCNVTSQAYTVAPDGSNLTQLTKGGRNIEPNWSPDGQQIIYGHQPGVGPDHFPDLWTMDANGKNKEPVVQTKLWESEPDWGTAPSTSPER